MKALIGRLKGSQGYRAYQRYNAARGGLLAGGVSYFAFFSVFPALTMAFAIFGFVLRGHPSLFHDVVSSISTTLPGIVKDAGHPDGIIDASKPPAPDVLTVTGAVSFVVLVLSGLGWLGALREGIRSMFGQPTYQSNPVLGRLHDLGVLALLGVSMLVSGALSGGANTATGTVLGWIGVSTDSIVGRIVLPVVGFLVVLVVDLGIFLILLRLLSGLALPWVEIRQATIFGAVGCGLVKVAVSYGILGTSSNPLLASFAVVVGLLVVMNLLSRVTLLAAAWAATSRHELGQARSSGPDAVATLAAAQAQDRFAMAPSFGQRAEDRTAVAAGAVLGAVGAIGLGVLKRGAGAVVSAVRHRD